MKGGEASVAGHSEWSKQHPSALMAEQASLPVYSRHGSHGDRCRDSVVRGVFQGQAVLCMAKKEPRMDRCGAERTAVLGLRLFTRDHMG